MASEYMSLIPAFVREKLHGCIATINIKVTDYDIFGPKPPVVKTYEKSATTEMLPTEAHAMLAEHPEYKRIANVSEMLAHLKLHHSKNETPGFGGTTINTGYKYTKTGEGYGYMTITIEHEMYELDPCYEVRQEILITLSFPCLLEEIDSKGTICRCYTFTRELVDHLKHRPDGTAIFRRIAYSTK